MITVTEAQKLHELIGAALELVRNGSIEIITELEDALAIAAIIVSDRQEEVG